MPHCINTDFTIQASQSFEFDLQLQEFSFDIQTNNQFSFDICGEGFATSESIFTIIKNKMDTTVEYILTKKTSLIIKNKINIISEYVLNKKIGILIRNKMDIKSNLKMTKKIESTIVNKMRIGKFVQLFTIDNIKLIDLDVQTLEKISLSPSTYDFFQLSDYDSQQLNQIDNSTLGVLSQSETANFDGSGTQLLMEKKITSTIKNKMSTIINMDLFQFIRLSTHDSKQLSIIDIETLEDLDRILV